MLKINAIKIEVNTEDGLYGAEYRFDFGLNIIRGDNSTGKSSLFQAIIYALGFEELLGGKFEKTMQSVLKDQVEFPKNKFHNILQSYIYLEIENKEIVTIGRSVKSGGIRKSQLIDVYYGALLTGTNKELDRRAMYVHDAGGASNEFYGFHLFLAEFLGWELPETINSKGDIHKLYIQQIAAAFIIEQKTGWSDFFATIPYFGIKDTEQRVIEFLLKLDVFENERKRQQINFEKQQITNRWNEAFMKAQHLAERVGGKVTGLGNNPDIINESGGIFISVIRDQKNIGLRDLIDIEKESIRVIEQEQTGIPTVGKNLEKNEEQLKDLNDSLNQTTLNYDLLSPQLNFDREKLRQYENEVKSVQDDLEKNKAALKVKRLGAELTAQVASDICPTCHQDIKDSLLPNDIEQVPMRIEENISYLEAQEKMIEVYIEGQKKAIKDKIDRLENYRKFIGEARQKIRDIRKELIQDERLPSIVELEKRIDIKRRIELFEKVLKEFNELLKSFKNISDDYGRALAAANNLPKDFHSTLDREKITQLQTYFISILRHFNYQSKPFANIRISNDTYLPVAQKLDGEQLYYNIKFDSSASDFIRCIWAYTTALLKVAVEFDTNHPRLLVFDEPKQQDISINDFRKFLEELSQLKKEQVLLFASFENQDSSFIEATKGLEFSINKIEQKLIKPIVPILA